MTVHDAYLFGVDKLLPLYEKGESEAIILLVLEHLTGERLSTPVSLYSGNLQPKQQTHFLELIAELESGRPVQYVLGEAWFFNEKFLVDNSVLIPRQETEELVDWIIKDHLATKRNLRVLDIGTGSGCIPITLKKHLKTAEVTTCDISREALEIARKNAHNSGIDINFILLDFLDSASWSQLPAFDIIVSNPPYIPEKDMATMHTNVLSHEPSIALFVPDSDALLFYRAIASFGLKHLSPGGSIYCEIHEGMGESALELFGSFGYQSELKKDMQQKNRMIKSGLSIS